MTEVKELVNYSVYFIPSLRMCINYHGSNGETARGDFIVLGETAGEIVEMGAIKEKYTLGQLTTMLQSGELISLPQATFDSRKRDFKDDGVNGIYLMQLVAEIEQTPNTREKELERIIKEFNKETDELINRNKRYLHRAISGWLPDDQETE